jgi:thiol:disulfide interchange protein DsbD
MGVQRIFTFLVALLLIGTSEAAEKGHTHAKLLLGSSTARPGDQLLAGVHLRMDPGWHTYWKNSGASGAPTTIEWQLPDGITAGPVRWPVPEKLSEADLTTYTYKDDVVLLVPLKLASNLPQGPVQLRAKVEWLECEVLCVRGGAQIQATLEVGPETKPGPDADLLAQWEKKIPAPADALEPRAWWEKPPTGDQRSLMLQWKGSGGTPDFFPDSSESFEVQAETTIVEQREQVVIRKIVKKFSGDWPKQISGVLVQQTGNERKGYQCNLSVSDHAAKSPALTTAAGGKSLWAMLAYAFLGGLILNVMPCVLPVIALKILGFVGEAKNEPRHVRNLGLIYAAGVLASFLVLAGLVIGINAAGHKAGWGMQFSNPQFLVILTALVTLVALSLFGLFEINLSSTLVGAAGNLASRQGNAGAFFNGVLATILATPCTAPFLSVALGFAFAQSAGVIILFFLTIGAGLAFPYVLLSWHPGWLQFLPKPGAWMEKFKIAMGFPMLATALWLSSLIPIHYGERSWWLLIFLVILAMAAWVYGDFVQRGRSRRGLGLAVCAVLLVGGYVTVLEGQLRWRTTEETSGSAGSIKNQPEGIAWQPWSAEAVAAARAAGHPVLVDFTAKWCVTCNAIVKPALENEAVRKKLDELKVVPLLGDYTKFPGNITDELAQHGRAGVPLVLAYSKNPTEPPIVLPEPSPFQLPGQYSNVILKGLDQAAN